MMMALVISSVSLTSCSSSDDDDNNNGDSTYTITIEPLYILSGEDENGNPTASTQTTLVYKGNLPKAPRQSWD